MKQQGLIPLRPDEKRDVAQLRRNFKVYFKVLRSQYFSYGRQVELSLIAIHNDTDGVGGQYQHSSGLTLYYADSKITSLSKFNSITGMSKNSKKFKLL